MTESTTDIAERPSSIDAVAPVADAPGADAPGAENHSGNGTGLATGIAPADWALSGFRVVDRGVRAARATARSAARAAAARALQPPPPDTFDIDLRATWEAARVALALVYVFAAEAARATRRALAPLPGPSIEDGTPATGRHTATWRHALGAGLVCFGAWTLLDAPTLLHSAQASPLGSRRTVAITVLRPIAAVSGALGLSHVVGAADRVMGRTGTGVIQIVGPPARNDRLDAGHGSAVSYAAELIKRDLSSDSQATAPSVPTPPPLPEPNAAAPLRVLSVGDSLGVDFGSALVNDLAATGVVNAVLDAHVDTGLSRPDYFNWPAELQGDLARDQPQAVVVFLGANDPQNFVDGGTALAYGTPAWTDAYGRRVGAFMAAATAAGARVLWVGMPPMANGGLNAEMLSLNQIFESQAAAHPGVTYFPSWPVMSTPQGGFAAYLPESNGTMENVREPDGTHISPDGAERLSQAVIGEMDHVWGLNLTP